MNTETVVKVSLQGKAVVSDRGYLLKGNTGVGIVAFYVDAWGESGRVYPICTSNSVWTEEQHKNYPSVSLEDGQDIDSDITEIYFPEFEGWSVFSVSGGKTLSVCLVKREDNT